MRFRLKLNCFSVIKGHQWLMSFADCFEIYFYFYKSELKKFIIKFGGKSFLILVTLKVLKGIYILSQ